jgi:hypothetical protein
VNVRGPESASVAAACAWPIGVPLFQPGAAQLVEATPANTKLAGGSGGVQEAVIEVLERPGDELRRQAVDNLSLFKPGSSTKEAESRSR